MKEFFIALLELIGLACWVEIKTDSPRCTYYFGPFLSKSEATTARSGYVDDLQSEGTQGIQIEIKRCKPTDLTIFDEREEIKSFNPIPAFGSQAS